MKSEIIGKPYWMKNSQSDLHYKILCLSELLPNIQAKSVIEYFGGTGVSTALIDAHLKPETHTILEIDPTCINILKEGFPDKNIIETNSLRYTPDHIYDLTVLDYNKFTILHKFMVHAFDSPYIILTDSSPRYFHLNAQHYAKRLKTEIKTLEDYAFYYREYVKNKYKRILTHFYYFSHASYLLFQKDDFPLKVKRIESKRIHRIEEKI